jgi:outer membrane protein assembly factor BamD (BamD/ComL family)
VSAVPGAGPASAPPERPTATSVDARADELAALKQARSAVARGDYTAALRLLDAHRRAFPKGRLLEEGEALRIKALWGSGRRDQARSALTSFQRRFPGSVLGSGLKATVQASP